MTAWTKDELSKIGKADELTLTSMPMIRGSRRDTSVEPRGRVRNTRLMLVTAAVLMSVFLLSSTLVTTVLIPPHAEPGDRSHRVVFAGGRQVERAEHKLLRLVQDDRQRLHGPPPPGCQAFLT